MATILTKRSNTASSVPSGAALTNSSSGAELAVNTADKRLFVKDSGGTVQELGTNPSSLTLPNGTANGVPYLNGSKVLTSGSALTFDGTTLTSTLLSAAGLSVSANASAINLTNASYAQIVSTNSLLFDTTSGDFQFRPGGSEQMRLTSTGLGIGTSSPAGKLDVYGGNAYLNNASSSGSAALVGRSAGSNTWIVGPDNSINGGTDNGLSLYSYGATNLRFYTNATERMRLDASGNLGLGVTPSASTIRMLQGPNAEFVFAARYPYIASNTTYNSGWKYTNAEAATYFVQAAGQNQWWVSTGTPSAGAAATFTKAMTLDASGNIQLGSTANSFSARFYVQENSASEKNIAAFYESGAHNTCRIALYNDSSAASVQSIAGNLSFSTGGVGSGAERARIDSSGNLLVGTATAGAGIGFSTKVAVDAGNAEGSLFKNSAGASAYAARVWNSATTGDNLFVWFGTEAGGTTRGSITYNRGGGLTAYNTTSDYRAKDIISETIESGSTIDGLKIYVGKMKGATIERPMMIAHEAQAVVPYAVTGEKDAVSEDGTPKFQQMDHASLVPLLIAEIQSLRQRVAALEAAA